MRNERIKSYQRGLLIELKTAQRVTKAIRNVEFMENWKIMDINKTCNKLKILHSGNPHYPTNQTVATN
ncbi:MAG: hypothetical protein B6D64_06420 [Bacteroidetes bacterium 4484_276]|nr:MAG: hypothetical protein B6D64_06420 [Bacteroidetes bacterium 4484_276]